MVKKKLVYGLAALLLTGCGLTGLMGCGNKATAGRQDRDRNCLLQKRSSRYV